jgi:hypothetical protein
VLNEGSNEDVFLWLLEDDESEVRPSNNPNSNCESGPSSIHSDDEIWSDPEVMETELELMGMFISMAEFQLRLIEMPVVRRPQRTLELDGPSWVHWVLNNPNENTCWEQFHMLPHTFLALCNMLKHNGFLQSSRYMKITEQLVVFILIMAQNHSQRATANRL